MNMTMKVIIGKSTDIIRIINPKSGAFCIGVTYATSPFGKPVAYVKPLPAASVVLAGKLNNHVSVNIFPVFVIVQEVLLPIGP